MRSKRWRRLWNEHVKLFSGFVNLVAIGILGMAVIGPIFQPDNPIVGWAIDEEKLRSLGMSSPSLWDVIQWNAVLMAIALHLLAHAILRVTLDDD